MSPELMCFKTGDKNKSHVFFISHSCWETTWHFNVENNSSIWQRCSSSLFPTLKKHLPSAQIASLWQILGVFPISKSSWNYFQCYKFLIWSSSSHLLLFMSNRTLEKILHIMTESTANMEKSHWGKCFGTVFTQCKWTLPTKMLSILGF